MEENIWGPIVIIVLVLGFAFFTKKAPSASIISNGVKTVFRSGDDLVKFADEIYYMTGAGLKEVAASKTAIPIAASTGTIIGYKFSTLEGEEVVILNNEQKVLKPTAQLQTISGAELLQKTSPQQSITPNASKFKPLNQNKTIITGGIKVNVDSATQKILNAKRVQQNSGN